MRTYKISNIYHKVFDDKEELPSGIDVVPEWRDANIGDWVQADDGCYIQILRKGTMQTRGENIEPVTMLARVLELLCVIRM